MYDFVYLVFSYEIKSKRNIFLNTLTPKFGKNQEVYLTVIIISIGLNTMDIDN